MLIGLLREGQWFRCPRLRVEGVIIYQRPSRSVIRLRAMQKFPPQPDLEPGRLCPRIPVKPDWDVEPMAPESAQASPPGKLWPPDVLEIRESRKTNRELASVFHVSPSTISRVRRSQTWRWL